VNIYVGNLSRSVSKWDLQQAFEAFGENDKELKGQVLKVNEASHRKIAIEGGYQRYWYH
jgi:hypothetical protein